MDDRSGEAGHGSFAAFHEEAYARFPQERRTAGSAPLTLIEIAQDSHETVDAAVPELVLAIGVEADVRRAEFDVGDGWAPFRARAGAVLCVPAGVEMANRIEGPHRLLMLAAPWGGVRGLLDRGPAGDDPFRALAGRCLESPAVPALLRRLWAEAGRDATAAKLMVDGLFHQLLATLLRLAGAPERSFTPAAPLDAHRLARATDHAEARLDGTLTVAELARAACLSAPHFARAFCAATGRTPHAWVTARRIERARRLLADPARPPLAEVALACGFGSQSHFTRVFRAHTGATPAAYRAEVTA